MPDKSSNGAVSSCSGGTLSRQQLLLLKRRNPAKYRPTTSSTAGPITMPKVSLKRNNSDRKLSTATPGVLTLETSTTRTMSMPRDSTTDELLSAASDKSTTLRSVLDHVKRYYQDRTTEQVLDVKPEEGSLVVAEQHRFGSGQSRLISSTIISQGPERTVKDYVVEKEVKIPKKVTRDEVIEKTVVVLEKRLVEEIVEVPEKRLETVVHVRTPIVTEKVVEVPEYELVEKTVMVPQKIKMQRPAPDIPRNIPVSVEVVSQLELILPTIRSSLKSVTLPMYVPRFIEVPVTAEFCDEKLLNTADKLSKDLSEILAESTGVGDVLGKPGREIGKISRLDALATEMNEFTKALCDKGILQNTTHSGVGINNNQNEKENTTSDVRRQNFTEWWRSNEITFKGNFERGEADHGQNNGKNLFITGGEETVTLETKSANELVTLVENVSDENNEPRTCSETDDGDGNYMRSSNFKSNNFSSNDPSRCYDYNDDVTHNEEEEQDQLTHDQIGELLEIEREQEVGSRSADDSDTVSNCYDENREQEESVADVTVHERYVLVPPARRSYSSSSCGSSESSWSSSSSQLSSSQQSSV